jgi:transaldolase
MNHLLEIRQYGQRIWLDNLARGLIAGGGLQKLIAEDGLAGITTNPSIFHKAIADGAHYRDDLARLKATELNPEQRYEALAIPDIQAACDLLRPAYDHSGGEDGYVSLEVSPHLAHDVAGTLAAAERLAGAVQRDNLLVKIPATEVGVAALEALTGKGYKINVTLIFSLRHYRAVAAAYIRGLEKWAWGGGKACQVKSVASLFLSRTDALVDRRLEAIGSPEALLLRGQAAVAVAKVAYQHYGERFHGKDFWDLRRAGARPQNLLWASTGTKNPAYSDVLYVESLIGPETVNTMPDGTLAAFRDHGHSDATLKDGYTAAANHLLQLRELGIDLDAEGEDLQRDGLQSFVQAYDELLGLLA